MIFEIPEATPSNNVVMRMHHRKRSREHIRVAWLVRSIVGHRKPVKECKMKITRYGDRFLDWDNMSGGLKFLLDAMVKCNLVVDDNPNCITALELHQVKCKRKDEKTVIEIK